MFYNLYNEEKIEFINKTLQDILSQIVNTIVFL